MNKQKLELYESPAVIKHIDILQRITTRIAGNSAACKAWKDGKGLLGIYIHNIQFPRNGKCNKGKNPFEQFSFNDGTTISTKVKCYNPKSDNAYNDIAKNLEDWIEDAIESRKQ